MSEATAIAQTLENEAQKCLEAAEAHQRNAAKHEGARDVVKSMAAGMNSISTRTQQEIEEDEEHLARAMKRVAHSLVETAKNQQNQIMVEEGKALAMRNMDTHLRKQAEVQIGRERARAESVAMGEANKAAREEAKAEKEPKPKAKRKRTTKAKPKAKAKAKNGATEKAKPEPKGRETAPVN